MTILCFHRKTTELGVRKFGYEAISATLHCINLGKYSTWTSTFPSGHNSMNFPTTLSAGSLDMSFISPNFTSNSLELLATKQVSHPGPYPRAFHSLFFQES